MPYVNPELNIKRDTMGEKALKYSIQRDEAAERCRLLYVAMTRARERLILTGCCTGQCKSNWLMEDTEFRVTSADSMMDWVMQAVCDDTGIRQLQDYEDEDQPWKIVIEPDEDADEARQAAEHRAADYVQTLLNTPGEDHAMPWWQDEPAQKTAQPIKTSVSSLARQQVLHDPMPLSDSDEEAEDKRVAENVVAPLRMSELPSRPAFMEEKKQTSAERGSLMHKFLSMASLEELRGL